MICLCTKVLVLTVAKFKLDHIYEPFLNLPLLPSPSRTWLMSSRCLSTKSRSRLSLSTGFTKSTHNSSLPYSGDQVLLHHHLLRFVWTLPRIHGGGIITICYMKHKNTQITCSCLAQFLPWYSRSPPGYKLSFSRLPLSINYQDTGLYLLLLSSCPVCTWLYSPTIQPQWTKNLP